MINRRTLCKRLLAEINDLISSNEAAVWAHRSMAHKNISTAVETPQVDEKFRTKPMNLAAAVERPSSQKDVVPLPDTAG
jgi:hypothetical protein